MTITYTFKEGESVVYTDGLCFVNAEDSNNLPGIPFVGASSTNYNFTNEPFNKPKMFDLTEGWWWVPPSYRMSVYTANEILSNGFLDISRRITIEAGNFVYLEKEIELPPYSPGMQKEIYYDISFHDEESLIECLREDLTIIDKGNLIQWKNKLQIIDILYA